MHGQIELARSYLECLVTLSDKRCPMHTVCWTVAARTAALVMDR
jgi:hypothetical protein